MPRNFHTSHVKMFGSVFVVVVIVIVVVVFLLFVVAVWWLFFCAYLFVYLLQCFFCKLNLR